MWFFSCGPPYIIGTVRNVMQGVPWSISHKKTTFSTRNHPSSRWLELGANIW